MTFRELVQEATMSYEDWIKKSDELNKIVDDADDELKAVVGKTNGGLVPDDVRASKEYKDASTKFNRAFSVLKDFNKKSDKKFMQRKSKEHRAKRMGK